MSITRRVVSGTCAIHPGTPGFCNVVLTADEDGWLVITPHAVGACELSFDEAEARALYAAIGELLG